jgi:hypothetical protein
MAKTINKVSFWRGTRAQYEALGANTSPDTYYTVKEEDGRWSYFYGPQMIFERSGQLMPAKELLEFADFTSEVKEAMVAGKTRYIIHDANKEMPGLTYPDDYTGYYEIEKRVDNKFQVVFLEMGVSVRIGGRKLYKTFQMTENEGFRTYDDGNCGEY